MFRYPWKLISSHTAGNAAGRVRDCKTGPACTPPCEAAIQGQQQYRARAAPSNTCCGSVACYLCIRHLTQRPEMAGTMRPCPDADKLWTQLRA